MSPMLLLAACGATGTQTSQQTASSSSAQGTMSVSASFYPIAFFAEQIGQEHVNVLQVTPSGVEPHDFDPSAQQLARVNDAKVFLMNGAGVDSWGDKIIDDLKQSGTVTVRMTDTISPMGGFNEEGFTDPTQPPSSEFSAVPDPHIWLDPVNAEKEAALIRDAFITADPVHADAYTSNADSLLASLRALDQEYRSGLAHCAINDVVVSHNAFRYMAQEYGFRTLAISGLTPDEEPSAQRIAELANFAKKNGIKYIFFETLVSPKLSQTVADEIGAQSLVLDPLEGLTDAEAAHGDNYITLMKNNLQNLRTAMQCQ